MTLDPNLGSIGARAASPLRGGDTETATSVLGAIRAHIVVVIAVMLVTVGASTVYLARTSRTYTATARLLVTPIDPQDAPFLDVPLILNTGDPVRTMETAVILMDTTDNARLAAQMLGGHWTAAAVRGATQVLPAGQSNVVDVTASATSPKMAARLAADYVSALVANRKATLQRAGTTALANVQAQLARIKDPNSATATALERQVAVLQAMKSGIDPNIAHAEAATTSGGAQERSSQWEPRSS
jgi:uncharacterized protein involved in exopolysaccharide biosynthesis